MIGNPRPLNESFLEAAGFDPQRAVGMAEAHRKFDCKNYDDCLTFAATRPVRGRAPGWQGFSCFGCNHG